MTESEAIKETMRRVLRQTTLRAILRPLGRTPIEVAKHEQDELLEPYEAAIGGDFLICCLAADQLVALSLRGAALEEPEEEPDLRLSSDDENSDP